MASRRWSRSRLVMRARVQAADLVGLEGGALEADVNLCSHEGDAVEFGNQVARLLPRRDRYERCAMPWRFDDVERTNVGNRLKEASVKRGQEGRDGPASPTGSRCGGVTRGSFG